MSSALILLIGLPFARPSQMQPAARAGANWWSLQPIKMPALPSVRIRGWVRNPIDAFVLAALERKGLKPAPPADRATLLRRISYDLTGLPPTPQEIDTFIRDTRPDAYERQVDRLLASPAYGERWARHWLDVARFGESHGYEYDHIRDNAWRYRDYVIRALNEDRPYDRFLKEQIAGDALPDQPEDGVIATGFLVGGPMHEAGKSAAGLLVRLRAREEEMEDMVGLIGQTCLGLTTNCARCHDHKFDPITQRDYYRLRAALDGVQPGNRSALTTAQQAARKYERDKLARQSSEIASRIADIEAPTRTAALTSKGISASAVPHPLVRFTFERDSTDAALGGELLSGATIAGGRLKLTGSATFRSVPLNRTVRAKTLECWVYLSDTDRQHGGSALTIENDDGSQFDAIVFGERQRGKWIGGSEGFQRTRDLTAPDETESPSRAVHMAIVYSEDNRITLYRNGRPYGESYVPGSSLRTYQAGKSHLLIGLRHTGARDYLQGDIEEARLYDRALSAEEVAASFQAGPDRISDEELIRLLNPEQRAERDRLLKQRGEINAQIRQLDDEPQAYAAVSSKPQPAHILRRGDPTAPADPVTPGGIAAVRGASCDFGLTDESPDSVRRLRLAEWITDCRNPLTWRVIVNRVWQGHFGRGIVGTPNDFGFNGERPTHPELLDWLAASFVEQPSTRTSTIPAQRPNDPMTQRPSLARSLKALHRIILLSNAYRQSSRYNGAAAAVDADDRLLWRFAPQRLEAEAVRDSMLVLGGNLDRTAGGPGFRPFTVSNFGSSFYQLIDEERPEFNRRSIYRTTVQSARNPLLDSFDCPDPSTKTPRRSVTTTPIQALELMNDAFVNRQARHYADRVSRESDGDARIVLACRLAWGRAPSPDELASAKKLVKLHGLESYCWALLNSTEFLYVR